MRLSKFKLLHHEVIRIIVSVIIRMSECITSKIKSQQVDITISKNQALQIFVLFIVYNDTVLQYLTETYLN